MRFIREEVHTEKQRNRGNFVKCCILTILLTCFLMIGCMEDGGHEGIWIEKASLDISWLEGKWATEWDYFEIKEDMTLFYDGGYGFDYKGDIQGVYIFNIEGSAGIIFIKYTKKVADYDTGIVPTGDYIGIYYKNLTATQVEFAIPSEEFQTGKYITPAKASLNEARIAFTEGTLGNYINYWSVCTKS